MKSFRDSLETESLKEVYDSLNEAAARILALSPSDSQHSMPTTILGIAERLDEIDSDLVFQIGRSWHECNDYWKRTHMVQWKAAAREMKTAYLLINQTFAMKSKKDGRKMPPYDVAISFAGEDRNIAEDIARQLQGVSLTVFYDKYEQSNLWGKNLYSHLISIYRDEAKFCLMLISDHYAKKQWTNHEREAAQSRAFNSNHEYILPLILDDTSIEGVLDTVGFLDFRNTSTAFVVDSVLKKVLDYNHKHGFFQSGTKK